MSCHQLCGGARKHRSKRHANGAAATRVSSVPHVLSGTWDFKWPVGSQLRVAFQKLPVDVPDLDFDLGKALAVNKLRAWLGGRSSAGIQRANLGFKIMPDVPAPLRAPGEGLRGCKSASSFSGSFVDYDILISFLPLPVLVPATEQHDEQVIGTSASELGRYARRIEYGVPTTYLGPQPNFKGDWFRSPVGIFTVVHELGHVLGMAHEQQNPRTASLPWRPLDQMVEVVRHRGGLAAGTSVVDFIKEEVIGRWPGELQFSDWREPPSAPHFLFDSVMAKPSYRCLLVNGHEGSTCTSPSHCEHEARAIAALDAPTNADLHHLLAMYGAPQQGQWREARSAAE